MSYRNVLSFFVCVTFLSVLFSCPAFGVFGSPPTDQPYYSQSNAGGYTAGPTYGYDENSTGTIWSEAQVNDHTLQAQFYYSDNFDEYVDWTNDAGAEYIQQYIADDSTQQISFDWDGELSLTGPPTGNYWISYSLMLNIGVWHPDWGSWEDSGSWEWITGPFGIKWTANRDQSNQGTLIINESETYEYNFEPGTRFATWFYLSAMGGATVGGISGDVTAHSDFYNTFELTGVTGASAIPEPMTMLMFIIGAALIRRTF